MRCTLLLATIFFICPVALAGEAVLKLQTSDAQNPFHSVNTREIQYESTLKPGGVVSPEGELDWGRLTLGRRSYLLCITRENGKLTKLYLDRDTDKNLAEETPVQAMQVGRWVYFVLESVPGEFALGENSISIKMRLLIMPVLRGYVPVCTAYVGKIKDAGDKASIVWVPGKWPYFRPALWKSECPVLYIGSKKLIIGQNDVAFKDGKVVATYRVEKGEESLIPVAAPKWLHSVRLFRQRFETVCLPADGKLFLRKGKCAFLSLGFVKESEGVSCEADAVFPGDLVIREGMTLGKLEPLTLAIEVSQKDSSVSITPSLTDASGRQTSLSKNCKPVPAPKLIIKDPGGKEVANHQFEYGEGGYQPFPWQVPDELKAKELTAEIQFEKTAFEVNVEKATFKVEK